MAGEGDLIPRWGYYVTSALKAGVPPMWAEDAAADIAVRVWQAGDPPYWRKVVQRTAIDAARMYGPRSRDRTRPEMVPLEGARLVSRDRTDAVVAILDFRAAWPRLTTGQRAAVLRAITKTNGNRSGNFAWRGRQRLRKLCA